MPLSIFLNGVQQIYKSKSILYNQYKELKILIRAKLAAASKLKEGDIEGVNKYLNFSNAEDLEIGSRLLKQHIYN